MQIFKVQWDAGEGGCYLQEILSELVTNMWPSAFTLE